jgi:hypothetical protein
MNEITIRHFIENDTAIVSVPLSNSKRSVELYQQDFDCLTASGLDPRWTLSNGQILERGTRLSVTRLVADANKGEKVRLLDNDPCNLKRCNLLKGRGGGRFSAKDRLSNIEERPHKFKTTINHLYDQPKHLKEII